MTNTDLMNVQAFNNVVPAGAFAALNPESESLADGIGASYGIVGYKGKNWSLRHRGEKYNFVRPDDGSPRAFLDVIILRSASYKSKSYYAGTYVEGQDGARPTCAALDGVTPDADVLTPQSSACAICPRNVFGVNAEGRKSKDCGDYKRLAVLIIPSLTAPLLGAALMEPVFLRVPAASLNDLATMGEAMQKKGFHYSTYVTRIGFAPDKAHPQMTFRALQPLTNAEGPLVLPMREDPQAYRITGENEVGKPRATIAAPAVSNVVSIQKAAAPIVIVKAPEPETVDTGFGVMGAAQQAANVARPGANVVIDVKPNVVIDVKPNVVQPAEEVVEVGLIGLGQQAQPAAGPSAPTANTVEDTGAPEEADIDLDARVAALLQR